MLSFLVYLVYTQTHSFLKSLEAIVRGKATTIAVTRPLVDALQVQFYRTPDSQELACGRVMYLANHRSWADFMVDSVLTNGGSYLARYGVFFGVPMSCFYGWVSGSVFFFHRQKGIDRDAFARFIETSWNYRPATGLIVYPEGTRNLKQVSLPLKKGALEAAYKLKVPIQVIITTNKENMINERSLSVQTHTKMVVFYSRVIHPKDFDTLQAWFAAIQELWDESWKKCHECTEPQPFEGQSLDLITKAKSEPAVRHRVLIARAVLLLAAAILAERALRRLR